ncbi:hypothetical protein ACIBCT_31445 [Streptosporangium sp. NPDC050855]|uniref:hypothetical protein n=1 Tax=Streptosporangium sp. NPDC050855 TaxID=3366194 RepID=UPI0037A44965
MIRLLPWAKQKSRITLAASGPFLPRPPFRRIWRLTGLQPRVHFEAVATAARGDHAANLSYYDVIVVNHSGGKDSSVALYEAVRLAEAAGVRDRLVVLHNDLGRVEWPATRTLDAQHANYYRTRFGATLVELFGDRPSARDVAERQATRYGLPFVVRSRTGGDLLQQIEQYGKFPDAGNRHCTSEQKRAPKHRLYTELVKLANLDRQIRILDINGERGEESPARKAKPAFEYNRMASNKTKRKVHTWRVVHSWTLAEVWACHWANNLEWHWAYEIMSRLSCSICVLAAISDVTWGCAMRPDLSHDILAIEGRVDHLFRHKRSISWFIDKADTLTVGDLVARRAVTAAVRAADGNPQRDSLPSCTIPAARQSVARLAGRSEPAVQDGLFTEQDVAPAEAASLPYIAANPTAASTALTGDCYGWLAAFLPPPRALTCSRCGQPMSLATVPLLWECSPCDIPAIADAPSQPKSDLAA